MGAASFAGVLTYQDAEGVDHTSSQAGSLNFTLRQEGELEQAGSGVINVPFGSIMTASVITIETLLGEIAEARYDGMASGIKQNVNGVSVLFDVAVTAVALRHDATLKAKVIVLGDA